MSRTFKITRDCYDEGDYLYKRDSITLKPGVTVLVGCNGSGKTTLLDQIGCRLKDADIEYLSYSNISDGRWEKDLALQSEDFSWLAQAAFSSEGEEVSLNMRKVASKIGRYAKTHPDQSELWILLDAMDSGLSIDNVVDYKDLFSLVIEDNARKDVYIVISCNEYELARRENCFDVISGEYCKFRDYEDFRQFILDTRLYKDRRYSES